ncbi:DUF1223 domain-containing protein [Kaarinaea lacus]
MKTISTFLNLALTVLLTTPLAAETITFSSGKQQTLLLELYTSEGCSSCPPADRWLSTLKNDPRLWKQIIPVAFHVDYWNYLGWTDRFSKAEYAFRQRQYAKAGNANSVYTPGLFQNGREWRAWFGNSNLQTNIASNVGALTVSINSSMLKADYSPITAISSPLLLNVAVLGFNLSTDVVDGENQGKVLKHDFVVLSFKSYPNSATTANHSWRIDANTIPQATKHDLGLAVWVTHANNPTPLQSTGGWLK